ncbi:hypothetical protein B5M42_008980 [Paenibacillus athensensis]|uniref:Uncharacterized protein n=1 Tax=Paenibacillus athensensis TaxID=1967502 RepID=A0A4Y8Q994_9BACL|nr:hypothetical protein [Paenibacillus athensensis]MCD1258970.1 hypothetical protein [Paenibacillus athensensis]
MNNTDATRAYRRYNSFTETINSNIIHRRNPWITAWWSAALPGFGHLLLGIHVKGFILILWEIFINANAHINEAMVLSFTGRLEQAKQTLHMKWALLYIPVYIHAIWDSYRQTVDLNNICRLADYEQAPIVPFKMTGMALNYLDRRHPWLAACWSLLFPGLGHLYLHKIPTGFFLIVCTISISIYSGFAECLYELLSEPWTLPTGRMNPEWSLFLPSIYCFAAYDAQLTATEQNKLYKKEQRQFLRRSCQGRLDSLLQTKESE